jgi:hypothetical protein
MRMVEVTVIRSIASQLIEDMTDWFDRNGSPPLPLDTDREGIVVTIKVRFHQDDLAERFRRAFRGSYAK